MRDGSRNVRSARSGARSLNFEVRRSSPLQPVFVEPAGRAPTAPSYSSLSPSASSARRCFAWLPSSAQRHARELLPRHRRPASPRPAPCRPDRAGSRRSHRRAATRPSRPPCRGTCHSPLPAIVSFGHIPRTREMAGQTTARLRHPVVERRHREIDVRIDLLAMPRSPLHGDAALARATRRSPSSIGRRELEIAVARDRPAAQDSVEAARCCTCRAGPASASSPRDATARDYPSRPLGQQRTRVEILCLRP